MNYEQFITPHNKVFLVNMKEDKPTAMFSSLAQSTLENYLPKGKRVLIIGGKKGLASGVICQECGFIPQCTRCDIPIAYHRHRVGEQTSTSTFGICHICKHSYNPVDMCPKCQWYSMKFFGTGLQKIQEYIGEAFPGTATYTIDATTVSSLPKITRVSQELGSIAVLHSHFPVPGDEDSSEDVVGGNSAARGVKPSIGPQCLIATSLLQVPPKNRTPDAVIVIRADSSLGVPDWKVAEHAYSMLAATIANYHCPIIVQSYNVEHHAIRAACAQKPEMFRSQENVFREAHGYPPYGELAVLLYKHEVEKTMFTRVNKLYQELLFCAERDGWKGEIFATPPLVYKIYDKYRYNIVLQGSDVRMFLDRTFVELQMRERGFKVDWMPEGLLG